MYSENNDFLTVDDVCELLYIGKNMVYSLLKTGKLKGIRFGRVWRIPKESIERMVLERFGDES